MKILLGDFNAKLGESDILKRTIGTEGLHNYSNGNGVRIVNFATSTNLVVNPSAWSDGHCPHAARSHSFVYISTS